LSSSRGDEVCGGAITRALAIEVAQRVLVDVAERERRHEWRHGETIAVRIVEQADDRPDFDVRAHRGLHRQHRENFELEPVDCPERAI
jgi:hypothetical protein